MLALGPLADSLETYARQIRAIADIIRSIEEEQQKVKEEQQQKKMTPMRRAEKPVVWPMPPAEKTVKQGGPPWRPLPMIGETLNKAAPVIEACATPVDDPLRHDALMQTILTQRKVTARRLGATNENPAAANLVAAAHSSTLRRGAFRTIVALTILIVLTGPLA